MSTSAKGSVLRLILPEESKKLLSQLGPAQKLESRKIILQPGRLTTEEITRYIRDYTKLRDDVFHTVRLLGAQREARDTAEESGNIGSKLAEYWKGLDEVKTRHRQLMSSIERSEREVEDAERKATVLGELLETGFSIDQVESKGVGFNKILGRIQTRRLSEARRALSNLLKDQAVIAAGNRKGDWTYLLVAVPADKTQQALQTLVLNDFAQTDVPTVDQPDLKVALEAQKERKDKAQHELEIERKKFQDFVREASESLNRLADKAQETLIFLRAVLRIGQGRNAEHAFTILEKTPTAKVMELLGKSGALVEAE